MRSPSPKRVRSLSDSTIAELLKGLREPVRLASISPHGFPLISTLWFLYEDEQLWCITQERTLLRRNLSLNPRCAFEIALDGARYRLLRGQGVATLDLADGGRVTERMIAHYLDDSNGPAATRLPAQIPTEYAIRIAPRWVRGQG